MKLALFDLDHTLLDGASENEWGEYLISHGVLDPVIYRERRSLFYQDYCQGKLDIEALLQFQLEFLTCYPNEMLYKWRNEYIEQRISPLILKEGVKIIEQHRKDGAELILITATHEFLTEPIAQLLGIKHLIASKVEKDLQGNYTGRSFGIPSYGEGKVARFKEWLINQGCALSDYKEVSFYSDSYNDLPLLSMIQHPVAVNPDELLLKYAQQKNWPIVDFGVRRK